MPGGRPSKYDPEHCETVVALGSQGKSKVEIAHEIGVNRTTIDEWARVHPEFSRAITRAKEAEQIWWERKGRDNLESQVFQASMWSRSMAARFPKDWREKTAHVGGDDDDNPIKTESKVDLGLDEFARRIAGIASRSDQDGGDQSANT
jgi:hypothetical protein